MRTWRWPRGGSESHARHGPLCARPLSTRCLASPLCLLLLPALDCLYCLPRPSAPAPPLLSRRPTVVGAATRRLLCCLLEALSREEAVSVHLGVGWLECERRRVATTLRAESTTPPNADADARMWDALRVRGQLARPRAPCAALPSCRKCAVETG